MVEGIAPDEMPRVSAITPTYNRAEHIEGAIETVLNQTHDDVEHVIVNDASTDDTREVLAAYEDHDRVRVFHNEENRGISSGFNRAAAEATGDYYCILGDDDRWHPTKVEKQVAKFEELGDDYGVVYTGGMMTLDGRITIRYRSTPERLGDIYPDVLAKFGLSPHSSHMIRADAYHDVGGFDTGFPRGVDWEMTVRLAETYKFGAVDEPLVERPRHGTNISGEPEQLEVLDMMWEKHREAYERNPEVRERFLTTWEDSKTYVHLRWGDQQRAIEASYRALGREPTPKRAAMFGFSLLGRRAFEAAMKARHAVSDLRANHRDGEITKDWWYGRSRAPGE